MNGRPFNMITRFWFASFFGLTLVGAASCLAQENIRFATVDIYVDSGTASFAAYQLEFKAVGGNVKIAGIEGGEHVAFKEPPFCDPKAMQQERAILAAFSTAKDLPRGKTRVATIHVQITGSAQPLWTVKLTTAADTRGKKIAATAEANERTKP